MSYIALLIIGIVIVYPLVTLPLMLYDFIQLKRWERKL